MATGRPPRREKKDFRFVSELDEPSKSTMNLSNRVEGSKKNEISELERKLMQLEKKISNVDVSSDGSIDEQMERVVAISRQKLPLKQKTDTRPN
jgi:predicted  nucleic acid-binding Zn-ribbon protein